MPCSQDSAVMLIGRCAWHIRYFGVPRWDRIVSWRGFNLRFTDGICPRCLERFRTEHHAALARRRTTKAGASLSPEEAA